MVPGGVQMLRKLMKYEFRATSRTFLPLYGAFLLAALLLAVFDQMHQTWGNSLPWLDAAALVTGIAYGILFIAVMVMTAVVAFQRFYRNLFTDEGYLTHTLPVKTHTHVTAKLLVSVVWCIASIAVFFLSVLVLSIFNLQPAAYGEIFADLVKWIPESNWESWAFLLEIFLLVLLYLVCGILFVYMAIAAGNIAGRHKVALGIGVFIGTSVILQLVYLLGITLGVRSTFDLWKDIPDYTFPSWPLHGFLLGNIVFFLFFSAVFYILTSWILKRKLNLS